MQKKVLIADTDQILRALLRVGLEGVGYQVAEAADGLEAWQKLQDAPPDYLVLDPVIPPLGGTRLGGDLKVDPRFRSLPIFALTGTAHEAARDLAGWAVEAFIARRSPAEMIEDLLRAFHAFEQRERPALPEHLRGLAKPPSREIVLEFLADPAHLTALLQNVGEGIVLLNPAGRILYTNPAGVAIFQRSEIELLGVEVATLMAGQAGDSLRQAIAALASRGNDATMRLDASTHDRTLHLTLTNLLERGHVVEHLLLIRDVTPYAQRIQELRTLNELAALFTSTLQLDEVLQRVMDRIQTGLQAEAGSLLLKDPEAETLVFRIAVGEHKQAVEGRRLKVGEGIAGWVFREGVAALVPDAQQDPRFWPEMDTATGFTTRSMLCAPLRARDQVIGVIQVMNSRLSRAFTEEDLKLLCAIAAQAAIAIENARLHEATLHQLRELRALHDIGQAIASSLTLDEQLKILVERLGEALGAQRVLVGLLDPGTTGGFRLSLAYDTTKADPWLRRVSLPPAHYPEIQQAIRMGRPLVIPEVAAESLFGPVQAQLAHLDLRSLVIMPLMVRERAIGAISLGYVGERRPFTDEEVSLLHAFAAQAAIAIEKAELFADTERAAREARSLYEVAHSLATSLDPMELLQLIAGKTTELLGTPHAQVTLWDEATQSLRLGAAYGTEAEKVKDQMFRPGEGVNGIVAQTRAALLVNDYQAFPQRVRALTHVVAVIGVPLLYRGQFLGVLTSHATQPGFLFTSEHLALLKSFADQAAIVLENARLYEAIRRHAADLEARVQERTRELEAMNERLQEASRHKSEFLANMSHELRTPLNSIIGFAELLTGQGFGPLTERQARYLGHIQNSGKHLLQLINDILDLSKVEAGKFVLQLHPLPVAQTLEEILVVARGLANIKSQEIHADIAPNLPPLTADPVRFKQILFNLLSNAAKFTPEQGRIMLGARQVSGGVGEPATDAMGQRGGDGERGPWLEVQVTDTGIGIKAEDLPRLFQEFVQLDAAMGKRDEGTGLGLALTKRLVELHGGRIWAGSGGEGRGTTFTVLLPFAGSGAPPDTPSEILSS